MLLRQGAPMLHGGCSGGGQGRLHLAAPTELAAARPVQQQQRQWQRQARPPAGRRSRRSAAAVHAAAAHEGATTGPAQGGRTADNEQSTAGDAFIMWLMENGAPEQGLELQTVYPSSSTAGDASSSSSSSSSSNPDDLPIDMAVAKRPLQVGEVALFMPESLVITMERVFECEFVAELLTADKLSELAALALFLMYEKKLGEESFWQPYIKELDRQRARGTTLGVESPLLWEEEELQDLLQGSPLLAAVRQRELGVQKEYKELDTVWFMAHSLFTRYPFDLPTHTFSYEVFKQAFAAVQASIVHLQGMPLAKRFALVPLGPPLLSYSSTSKAMLSFNMDRGGVELKMDRPYQRGDPVTAWCGPQPNTRLLLNYGLVDEDNPYDKLQLSAVIASTDPLFQLKKATLQANQLASSQTFDLAKGKPLPATLLPYMRLAAASSVEEVQQVAFGTSARPVANDQEALVNSLVVSALKRRLAAYKNSIEHDEATVANTTLPPRQRVAARLTKIEKAILLDALAQLPSGAEGEAAPAPALPHLKLT